MRLSAAVENNRNVIDPFNFVIDSNDFIDSCRVMLALLGFLLMVICLTRYLQRERKWSAISIGTLGLLAAMQQIEALTEPLLVWRLPLYLVAVLAGIRYMTYTIEDIRDRASQMSEDKRGEP